MPAGLAVFTSQLSSASCTQRPSLRAWVVLVSAANAADAPALKTKPIETRLMTNFRIIDPPLFGPSPVRPIVRVVPRARPQAKGSALERDLAVDHHQSR